MIAAILKPHVSMRQMYLVHQNKGFSLVEVLISIVVLSIGLLGAAQLTLVLINSNAQGKNQTKAMTLVHDRIENVINSNIANLDRSENGFEEAYGTIEHYEGFKRVTTATPTDPGDPDPDMLTLTVAVYWNSDKKSVSATTIIVQ